MKRKCAYCLNEFEESELYESHNVPCYLFIQCGNRNGQKNFADKLGRKLLCKRCHDDYEKALNELLRIYAFNFSKQYFKEVDKDDTK
jgi:hypothetical protein